MIGTNKIRKVPLTDIWLSVSEENIADFFFNSEYRQLQNFNRIHTRMSNSGRDATTPNAFPLHNPYCDAGQRGLCRGEGGLAPIPVVQRGIEQEGLGFLGGALHWHHCGPAAWLGEGHMGNPE